MKKSTFISGAFIATLGIIISKILGIVYVIPFYSIIGEQGGALYGYAYNIYSVFLAISSVGLPLAISKLISEYDTLNYNHLKERVLKIARVLMVATGFLSFLILFIFAPSISYLILGDISGGNTIEDVTFVVRVISSAILIVPLLSVTRGYLQGHKYITASTVSTVLEQLIRVIVIVVGSFLVLRVFDLSLTTAVGVAVFGATVGAITSYLYIVLKINKNKEKLGRDIEETEEEKKITNKEIIKKMIIYAFPFVMIGVTRSLENVINMFTVVKTMVNDLHYTVSEAEAVMSVFSTWGIKLNIIVTSIATGLTVSLIPNLTSDFTKGNLPSMRNRISKSIEIILFITIPMVIGLSFLAEPVWNLFYGPSLIGVTVFSSSIFIAFFTALFTTVLSINQSLNRYKTVTISLIAALLLKIILNVPMMKLLDSFGFYASCGVVTATVISLSTLIIINLIDLKRQFNIDFSEIVRTLVKTIVGVLIMLGVLKLLNIFISIETIGKLNSLWVVALYSIIGGSIYFFIMSKFKVIKRLFGDAFFDKIKKKFKRK